MLGLAFFASHPLFVRVTVTRIHNEIPSHCSMRHTSCEIICKVAFRSAKVAMQFVTFAERKTTLETKPGPEIAQPRSRTSEARINPT